MTTMKNMKIDANGTEISIMGDVVNENAYISLTDIAKFKNKYLNSKIIYCLSIPRQCLRSQCPI